MWRLTVTPALFLTLILSPNFAQSQDCLQPPDALTPAELRQILGQLRELRTCREETTALREYIVQDREIDAREKTLADQRLELADEKLGLAEQAAALHKERADMYETLYRAVTRKPSFGCRIARAVTLGMYRCR